MITISADYTENNPSVILTWDLACNSDGDLIKENDPILSLIKEYEIYGYKNKSNQVEDVLESQWTQVPFFIIDFFET